MTSLRPLGLALSFLIVTFAGCADDPVASIDCALPANAAEEACMAPVPTVEATPTTGVIRCLVVDAAIRPVVGATVSVTPPGKPAMNTTTTTGGTCSFQGLDPGNYFVTARKTGYTTARSAVEVVAGVSDPPILKILLTADRATAPYVALYKFDGYIECSVASPVVRVAACDLAGDLTQDNFYAQYTLDQLPSWLQAEAVWESTNPLGESLQLSLTDFSQDGQQRINATEGPSPIMLAIDRETAQRFNIGINNTVDLRIFSSAAPGTDVVDEATFQGAYESSVYPAYNSTAPQQAKDAYGTAVTTCRGLSLGLGCNGPFDSAKCVQYPTLFNACFGVGGAGATVEQSFTLYTHAFYHFTPPAGWRFTEDGDPVLPA